MCEHCGNDRDGGSDLFVKYCDVHLERGDSGWRDSNANMTEIECPIEVGEIPEDSFLRG